MIGVMTFVTMVQFMLAFYCRRFENKIVRAYAEHHSSNVKTNLIGLAAAVLAIRYYWWIDPTGAIIVSSNAPGFFFFPSPFYCTVDNWVQLLYCFLIYFLSQKHHNYHLLCFV